MANYSSFSHVRTEIAILPSCGRGSGAVLSMTLDIPNLIRTRPDLIPGNIDVMCYGLAVEAIRSSVGNHRRE